MSFIQGARPASYKNIPFLVDSDEAEAGANRAEYQYINTGRRTSKYLGRFPQKFTIEAFIYDQDPDLYEQRRRNLEIVLNEAEPGILVHPFYGNRYCVPGRYRVRQSFAELNVCRFTIPFSVVTTVTDDPKVTEVATPVSIKNLATLAYTSLNEASATGLVNETGDQFESSTSIFGEFGTQLSDKISIVADSIEQANDYSDKALELETKRGFYMDNPSVAFAAVTDRILNIDSITEDTVSKYNALKNLFNFGDRGSDSDINVVSPIPIDQSPLTLGSARVKLNAESLQKNAQASITIEAFSQTGSTEFGNANEVDKSTAELEEQFQKIKDSLTEPEDVNIYTNALEIPDYYDAYNKISDLRDATYRYLEQQKIDLPFIQEINVQNTPASVLAYTIYGDSSRAQEIIDLNDITDNFDLDGNILILSE